MKEKNEVINNRLDIMLVFVSPVSRADEINYGEIPESVIQTNEAGLLYVQKELNKDGHSLDNVYCLSTRTVRVGKLSDSSRYNDWIKSDIFKAIGDVTHLDFLRQRMIKHDIFWNNRLIQIPCEDLDRTSEMGSVQILTDVAKISDKILQLRADHRATDIVVHCDITGGFRHASAMLMVILQLLRYHKMITGKVIYTDIGKKIYEINNLQSMFTLINGADEFVKYGSTQALEEYFEDIPDIDKSEELKKLLSAMKEFSQAIRLCVPNVIKMVTIQLKEAIYEFSRSAHTGSLEEEMLGKLMERISDEYKPFVVDGSEKFIPVSVIRWCIDKGLWQQAMTFAFELLPIYMSDIGIIYPVNEKDRRADSQHPHWQTRFFSNFNTADVDRYRAQMNNLLNEKFTVTTKKKKKKKMSGIISGDWSGKEANIRDGLELGSLHTDYEDRIDDIIKLLYSYNELRLIRHRFNHAVKLEKRLSDEIKSVKDLLNGYLSQLDTFRK